MTPIELPQWAMSPKNNSLTLYHSHNIRLEPGHSPVLMVGGVHGDEPEGVALAEGVFNWLSQATNEKVRPWVLIPCLNPDGYRAGTRTNGNGVDLNRNYPSSNWSPESQGERYFPGKKPGSEPEIQALVRLITVVQPSVIIHFHSWKPMIVVTGPQDLPEAIALSNASGYQIQANIGYPTPGSLSHYGWEDNKIPIICVEEQEHLSDLTQVWPRFKPGFQTIFNLDFSK